MVTREMKLLEKIQAGELVNLSDVTCPICLCILVEPVEMPCRHVICMPCYQENVTHANICCPVCRHRLSTWARRAKRENKLINFVIWNYIKEKFSEEVRSREEGEDVLDPDEMFPCLPNHQFAKEGEIKSEFDAVLAKEKEAREVEAKQEEEKSKDLITRFQMEYEMEQRQAREDEEFARIVHNTPSPGKENRLVKKKQVRGPLDSFISSSQQSSIPSSQSSQSSLTSSQGSQSVLSDIRSKPGNSSKSKLLFKSGNISAFLKENKMQPNPSPLSVKSENCPGNSRQNSPQPDCDAINSDKVSSVADHESSNSQSVCADKLCSADDHPSPESSSTQPMESSLLLCLEESPSLIENTRSRKAENCARLTQQRLSVEDKTIQQVEPEKQKFRTNSSQEMRGEKRKLEDVPDDTGGKRNMLETQFAQNVLEEQDMFGEESETLLTSVTQPPPSSGDGNSAVFSQDAGPPAENPKYSWQDVAGPSWRLNPNPEKDSQSQNLSSQSLRIIQEISTEGDFDDAFLEEQKKIVEQIEQEKKDLEMALKLQNELNKQSRSVDRRKGSENGYSFRATTPKSASGAGTNKKRRRSSGGGTSKKEKGKQLSLQESFKKTKLTFQESEEF